MFLFFLHTASFSLQPESKVVKSSVHLNLTLSAIEGVGRACGGSRVGEEAQGLGVWRCRFWILFFFFLFWPGLGFRAAALVGSLAPATPPKPWC